MSPILTPAKDIDAHNMSNYLVYQLTQGGHKKNIEYVIQPVPGEPGMNSLFVNTTESVQVCMADPATGKPLNKMTREQIDGFLTPVMSRIQKEFPQIGFTLVSEIAHVQPKQDLMGRVRSTLGKFREMFSPSDTHRPRM